MLPAPRLIRWILQLAGLYLAAMTLLRFGTYSVFHDVQTSPEQALPAFLLGLRFDLRIAASLALALLVLGSLPWFDPFRGPAQRRGWFAVLAVFHLGLAVLYAGDFLH